MNENQEILLFHHTYRGARYPWGLPGGWLNPREDPATGIIREIHEETGLNVRVVRPLLIENAVIFRRLDLIYWCEITSGEFCASTEVDAMQYFSRQALPDMLFSQRQSIFNIFGLMEKMSQPEITER